RTDGRTQPPAGVFDPRNEGRRHGAKPGKEDAEAPVGGSDIAGWSGHEVFCLQTDVPFERQRKELAMPLGGDPPRLAPVLHGALAFSDERCKGGLAAEPV